MPEALDPALSTPEAIRIFLNCVAGCVLRGELGPGQGQTLVSVANAALRVHELNLIARLDRLEQVAATLVQRGGG